MRVLVVSDVSGYMKGGVPTETRHLLRGLAARGHELALAGDIPLGGDAVRHFPLTLPTGDALARELGDALAAFRPDVVHVMAMGSRGVSLIGPALACYPWLFTCHSAPPYERKVGVFHAHEGLHYAARLARFLPNTLAWRWLLSHGRMPWVVVHSAFVQEIVERYGCDPSRVALIPLGHDFAEGFGDGAEAIEADPARVDRSPRLVTVGGLAHTKGQHDMVRAMRRIVDRHPDACYRMIGEVRDRSYLRFLEQLIDELHLKNHVQILQAVSNEEKERALGEADVYVQPSHEEGFCLAFIEAAARVPRLVGTDTGAIASVVDGDPDGRSVAPRAPEALAEATLDVLDRTPPAEAMSDRRLRLRTRFAWGSYLDAHERLYGEVIAAESGEKDRARV